MSSVTIEPPGGLSCGVPTCNEGRGMASATGQVPGSGAGGSQRSIFIPPVTTCETAVNIGILNGSQRRIGRSDTVPWCDGVGVCVRFLCCSHLISQ